MTENDSTFSGKTFDALIIGAGIAGLYQLHKLRGLGMTAHILEAADGVGGTWYWNRYPGARCDVQSMSYSYSFDEGLEQDWVWSEKYPTQPEILKYVNHVADRFDLRTAISFETRVAGAAWDDGNDRWQVTTTDGQPWSASWLIMATGCLSESKAPELPGLESYQGPTYHTGHWPHEGVDFTGMKVGVIGTGSSGIQSIPIIAQQASELTVFQRTPNFSMAAGNRPLSDDEIAEMKGTYRDWRDAQRHSAFGVPHPPATESALEVSEEERQRRYEEGWDKGDLVGVLGSFADTLTSKEANDTAAEFIRSKIRGIVNDPDVAETLSPRSFPFGTKRPCLDTGYYDTFNKEHVHLVDIRKTPLVEFTEAGIRTDVEEYAFDAMVFATGFDAMTGALESVDIRGRNGLSLKEKWGQGPRTYLGLTIAGFPNLFTVTGPLSPSVLSNMVVSIEQHVDWITDCIATARDGGKTTVEATTEAEDGWVDHVAELGAYTLFPTADSWYMGANVPGKPRVFMAYVGGVGTYRDKCTEIADNGYEGFTMTAG